ncbi:MULTISPECIES: class I SAM-dependent methyltransferase [Aneurinibacillus]|uniref:Methyltransferase domain-containing protein n=2 Tax=Aneurinibacillus thermoaerophilus TaxID=143495 RepID=A0A1G7YWS0_ANETH|nr:MULTISPECIES: class I SAM-dependent methyltransferase [Aneurinibacillus]AMA73164.1 SAM-dependent methyltransferase [Aneurinibacillus sp. XH2]MED0674415.1 class I SAM-dependent methyltransferase [Aneurinibacillus thermoaerophilus]MED0678432.1 class I SAM-dependent methyltransferase [Aneurinibacillus thermoaerophilus]MED0736044.1 class I SAM-dependent methyltransferase [Aneurinibacillus thermoaerophilus]MED0758960.1 class I SAM-dependent methyltransferase [Aneurinibacillus thermoaerophilus]
MLELTGERVIPHLMKPTNGLLLEHLARYYFAIPYAKGRVLDIACGAGYGSHMIAKNGKHGKQIVKEVVGVDVDKTTIRYAQKTYGHPHVTFRREDATDPNLPKKLGQFDTILSFETLEHLEDEAQFMKNLYMMLKPGGTLVLSTPFGKGRGKPCGVPFHVHQLTEQEFCELFSGYSQVEIYYQRGVTFEREKRDATYPLGIAVCEK